MGIEINGGELPNSPFSSEAKRIDCLFVAKSLRDGTRRLESLTGRVKRIRKVASGGCKGCGFFIHGTYPNSNGQDVEFIECAEGKDPVLEYKKNEKDMKCDSQWP